MPVKILMPALSPTMEHGNIAKWMKKEGDKIEAGEVIAEIETDKATMEVEAVDEGTLAKIIVPEGTENVAVNSLIAVLLEENENKDLLDDFIKQNTEESKKSEPLKEVELAQEKEIVKEVELADNKIVEKAKNSQKILNKNDRIFASPLAKRIAEMESVDLSMISGTGPHGRIIKDDVLAMANNSLSNKIIRHPQEYKLVENSNMRKIIAKRLLESKTTVPHFYLSIECMLDSLMAIRKDINSASEDASKRISVNDFIILAVAKALKKVPEANASWTESAMLMYNNVDVSVAVAIDGGIITPIIKNADQKDIFTISSEMKDLAKRARENSLKPEEFQGGGFSISNLGMYGIKNFNAIINPPQSCILSVGAGNKRAVVIDDKVEIRNVMDISLSCDHRVVDGAVGALFLKHFKKYIESPILMFCR